MMNTDRKCLSLIRRIFDLPRQASDGVPKMAIDGQAKSGSGNNVSLSHHGTERIKGWIALSENLSYHLDDDRKVRFGNGTLVCNAAYEHFDTRLNVSLVHVFE